MYTPTYRPFSDIWQNPFEGRNDDVNLIVDYESRKGRMDAAPFRNDDGELFGDNA